MARPVGAVGRRPHDMSGKILHWLYCVHCGLVSLRNDATRQQLRLGCWRWGDE